MTISRIIIAVMSGAFPVTLFAVDAQTPASPPAARQDVPRDIIVTAEPLSKLRRELDECLARHCPPKEDIGASLAYAEGQFVAGDYQASRATLLAARTRNARFAARLPVEVSSLQRANARLAGLNGASDQERISTFDMVDALKAGLHGQDARIILARLEVGDLEARRGRLPDALNTYRRVATQARRANLPAVEAFALFRKAGLLSAIARSDPSYQSSAREAIAAVLQLPGPAYADFRNGARLIALRMMPAKKQATAADTVLATLEPVDTGRPLLAYGPPVETAGMTTATMGNDSAGWADVGFTITSAGSVTDIRPIRTSAHLNPTWLAEALKALKGQRYVPRKTTSATVVPHVVRYSFVNDLIDVKATRLQERSNAVHVSEIDMTVYPDEKPGSTP